MDASTRIVIDRMIATMHHASGMGLAAPQVGLSKRVIVYQTVQKRVNAIINPVLKEVSREMSEHVEGCLSVPGLVGVVPRHAEITVTGLNEKGKPVVIRARGMEARILQHEIDHLDGILFMHKAHIGTLRFTE